MFERFVGIDLGTTGVRAMVFDQQARVLGEAGQEYPLHTPRPGWAEQDAETIADAAIGCLRRAARRAKAGKRVPLAIALSGTFHNVMPIDRRGKPLGRAMIWADTRAADEADWLRANSNAGTIYRETGCPTHPMYLPSKLRWLQKHGGPAPGYRSIKEYVGHRLTGQWACDFSLGSGTGMLDLGRKDWADDVLEIAQVGRGQLSPLVEPTDVIGTVTPEIARDAGISPESVVVAGAGDGVLSTLGSGTLNPGQMTAMIGTSGAVRVVTDAPRVDDERARTWCYYLAQDRWVAGAAINNGGLALRWTAEKLLRAGKREYDRVGDWAAEVPPGAGGLLFLPFLTGERAPHWNADARGVMFGLAIDHDHRHVARATFEGVCFRMRSIADALDEVAGPIHEVRASGGFQRSDFWLQMLADVLDRPLHVPTVHESSALGAAELAMIGTGALPNLAATAQFVDTTGPIVPDPTAHAVYDRMYALYRRVYDDVKDTFTEIARIQRGS